MIFTNAAIKKPTVPLSLGCTKELRLFDFSTSKPFVERNKHELLKFLPLKCTFCMLSEVFGIKVA